jgi:putative ABC transport system permease protein
VTTSHGWEPRSVAWAIGLFRRLSALMPRAYRRRHRDDAIALMARLTTDAHRHSGTRGVWRVALPAVFDLVVRLPAEYSVRADLDVLRGDVRYACRSLRRRPLSSVAAIATLAVGIGLNAAVFSVADWVLFRPLPYPAPHELVRVLSAGVAPMTRPGDLTYSEFQSYSRGTTLRASAAFSTATRVMAGQNVEPTHVVVARVTGDLFGTLGVPFDVGRGIERTDTAAGTRVVVLGDSLWRRRFGGDRAIIGCLVTIDRQAHTVIGVLPSGPGYPAGADVWRPMTPEEKEDNDRELVMIARLASGASEERAGVELGTLAGGSPGATRPVVESVQRAEVRDVRATLVALLLSSALVLLMACANVAALASARRAERVGEMAVRGALGASRGRLLCQLITEGVILAAAGGAAGLLLGRWALNVMVAAAPVGLPRLSEIALDGRIVGVGIGATLLVGLIVGLGPAFQVSRLDLRASLGAAGFARAAAPARGRRLLVVVQTAMAVVLTISAGLLARSLHHLVTIDHGFAAEHLLAVDLYLRGGVTSDGRALFRDLIDTAEAIPGVHSAAVTLRLPHEVAGLRTSVGREGQSGRGATATLRPVTRRYFETAGIPLAAGRAFTADDERGAPGVAIVNASFVRDVLRGGEALGTKLAIDLVDRPLAVVGVAADVTPAGNSDRPAIYVPMEQILVAGGSLLVRTYGDPLSIVPALTTRLRVVAPALARDRIVRVSDTLAEGRGVTRFSTQLASGFAALALLLASIGLYGLTAGEVVARWRELAVRMALGATRHEVLWTVLRPGAATLGAGVFVGVVASLATGRWMAALLHGVTPADPRTLLLVPGFLIAVGLAAVSLAALRVLRADPAATLRTD